MKELIEKIVVSVPAFLHDLIALFSNPRRYLRSQIEKDNSLSSAIVFSAIAFCVFFLLHPQPLYLEKDLLKHFPADISWHIVEILIITIVISTAWRIIGRRANFTGFLVISFYLYGGYQLIYTLFSKAALDGWAFYDIDSFKFFVSIIKSNSSAFSLYQDVLDGRPDSAETVRLVKEYSFHLSSKTLRVVVLIIALGVAVQIYWFLVCWRSFQDLTEASVKDSILALLVFILLFVPVSMVFLI